MLWEQPCRSHVTKTTRACPPQDGTWIYAFTTLTSRSHGPRWSFWISVLSFAIAFIWTNKSLGTLFFAEIGSQRKWWHNQGSEMALSHLSPPKHNQNSATTTPFLNLVTSPREGEAGEAQIQGHAKPHLLGGEQRLPLKRATHVATWGSVCVKGVIPRAALKHLSSVK